MKMFNANSDAHGGTWLQIGGSLEWLIDSTLELPRCDKVRLSNHRDDNSRQVPKNRNKRSHNTGIQMVQVFINSRSELVKGSHKRPYVTLSHLPVGGILRSSKSKARRHSAGQHVNGALAGEKGSKLPLHLRFIFAQSLTLRTI